VHYKNDDDDNIDDDDDDDDDGGGTALGEKQAVVNGRCSADVSWLADPSQQRRISVIQTQTGITLARLLC